jgi:uncharacterized membrane protein YgcG
MGAIANQSSTWLDTYNPIQAASKIGTVKETLGTTLSTKSPYSVNPSLNIYGSGADIQGAMKKYAGTPGVNFIDTSAQGFDPSTMQMGIMLGGKGVNTNITDDMLNKAGIQRVWGQDAGETSNALSKYMSTYGQPNMPTMPNMPNSNFSLNTKAPAYNPFQFNGSMQDYLDQAQGLMKPQFDLAVQDINDNYDKNYIPQANNDTLSRGLARSSYAGNRVDQLNASRSKDLINADMQNNQLINNMAIQNYDKAYDRAYNAWNADNQFNWNKYRADVQDQKDIYNINNQNAWKNFDANMALYNAQNDNYKWNKQFNNDNEWRQKEYNLKDRDSQWNNSRWAQEFVENNKHWQQQYDFEKQKFDWSKANSGGSGGSGGGGRGRSGGRSSGSGSDDYSSTDYKNPTQADMWRYANDSKAKAGKDKSVLKTKLDEFEKAANSSSLSEADRKYAEEQRQALLDGRWYSNR